MIYSALLVLGVQHSGSVKRLSTHTHTHTHTLFQILCPYQFSLVTQSCPTLYDPMDCSMPGFPVHHQLPELTQKLMSIESVIPSNHLILCRSLLLPPSKICPYKLLQNIEYNSWCYTVGPCWLSILHINISTLL